MGQPIGQLHQQLEAATRLLGGNEPDRNERKEQRDRQIKPAKGRDQDAVERRKLARKLRDRERRAACLGIEGDGLNEAVSDERRQQQQKDPQGTTGGELTHFFA